MAWIVLLLWLIVLPLCWIFIIIGSRLENISLLRTLGYSVFLSLGVASVLLVTTVLAAKMSLLVIAPRLDQIMQILSPEESPEAGCEPTVTFIGTRV